jgi:tRNA1(Val) A37 N6-methylase TrmN6
MPHNLIYQDYVYAPFYPFTEDSFALAHFCYRKLVVNKSDALSYRLIDLGCGSGIIGFELAQQLFINHSVIKKIDLVGIDYQADEYRLYWNQNGENVQKMLLEQRKMFSYELFCEDWRSEHSSFVMRHGERGIILANPPYYHRDKNKRPQDKRREQAKFWNDEEALFFIDLLRTLVRKGFECYFLLSKDFTFLLTEESGATLECEALHSHVSLFKWSQKSALET